MRTAGCTALGPGALVSTYMAKQHGLGSNVVICTDGAANVGKGNFGSSEAEYLDFYQKLGKTAAQAGVTINLIALVGAQCNVQALSLMCEQTGGLV